MRSARWNRGDRADVLRGGYPSRVPCKPADIEVELGPSGYTARGRCGEEVVFRPNVVLTPLHLEGAGCDGFRDRLLDVFGDGGSRSMVPRGTPGFLPYVFGRNPEQALEDE
jgi:hypothetical protein